MYTLMYTDIAKHYISIQRTLNCHTWLLSEANGNSALILIDSRDYPTDSNASAKGPSKMAPIRATPLNNIYF